MLKLFRFIFTSVTLALLISGCGSSSFQIQDSLSIKEGHHQYGLWWLKSRKLGSTHVRSDKIYVGKGRVYRSVQGKVYYAQIFPTWKAKTDWQPNFRAGKGFTLLSFSQEMCKKFGIDDLSKVDGCAKYKNYLFVRDISAFGLFDGASNLQYVDATQELNYLLQKISLHDFTFMQDRGSKQFVKLMIDSDVINNTITKELNEEHIQNYHAFAIKYLPKKSYTPYAYNKKMRYFHFMHNYDNVLKNGKLSEVQRLLSDAKGQVKKIKNGKSKVRKLQKREHSLLLKSKNIREIEKFYAKNKKYKDINRHLLKLYRASHTFENSLKAYKISHSLKDLDTAYALAKTEKRVKKVDKLLSKAHKLKTSKNIKKLSAFIKKYPKSTLISKTKKRVAALKAQEAKELKLTLQKLGRKGAMYSIRLTCQEITWSGSYNKKEQPVGKGTFKCTHKLERNVGAIIKITSQSDKLFDFGDVKVYIARYSGWFIFGSSEYSDTITKLYEGKSNLPPVISETINDAIENFNQKVQQKNNSRSSTSYSNSSYCSSSDTCFKVVKQISSKYNEYEIKCTKGNVGATKCISRKGDKWATNCPSFIRVGYHYSKREAGNRACQ